MTMIAIPWLMAIMIPLAASHSYMTRPTSRFESAEQSGCRGPSCTGPCDAPKSRLGEIHTAQRGDTISVEWPRNNHAGGFIRVAWTSFDDSDSHIAFDKGVQQYSCHEQQPGCRSASTFLNGGDNNPQDGSSNPCKTVITVPLHLKDGRVTMQWAWFGGLSSPVILGDFYSCADYQIKGGPTGAYLRPKFVGGDISHPNQDVCKFSNTRKLRVCVNEPCLNAPYPNSGNEVGVPIPTSSSEMPWVSAKTGVITSEGTGGSAPGGGGTTPAPPSVEQRCGSDFQNLRCPTGQCCSKYGYCGVGVDYCGATKAPATAPPQIPTTAPVEIVANVRSDGRCGAKFGGTTCLPGNCCSKYGYCGNTEDHCSDGATPVPVKSTVAPPATPATTSKCSGVTQGVVCDPGDCCDKFQFCSSGASLGDFSTNPGTLCIAGSITSATDERCSGKKCGDIATQVCQTGDKQFRCAGRCSTRFLFCDGVAPVGTFEAPNGYVCQNGAIIPQASCSARL